MSMSISTSANHPVLAIRQYANFETDVLPVLTTDQAVRARVLKEEARYTDIDIAGRMAELRTVGLLLHLAFMGSKNSDCNHIVMRLLVDYQMLGKNTEITCSRFLGTCMQGLKYHHIAFTFLDQKPDKSLKLICMISKIANEMSGVAGDLVTCVTTMSTLVKQALIAASNHSTVSTTERQQIKQQLDKLESQKDKNETIRDELEPTISAARENEANLVQSTMRNTAALREPVLFWLKEASLASAEVHHVDGTAAQAAQEASVKGNRHWNAIERERQLHAERVKLQEQDRHVKADLVESLAKRKSMTKVAGQLDMALQSLDLATKALGKLKTVFENLRVYWATVSSHQSKLANDGKNIMDLSGKGLEYLLAEAITNSWYSWLALANTNYNATLAINEGVNQVDQVVEDLPTTDEVPERLDSVKAQLDDAVL